MQKNFKEMVKRGERLLGTWAQMASAEAVEMIGLQGFDFAIIDTEHGFYGIETAENLVRTTK